MENHLLYILYKGLGVPAIECAPPGAGKEGVNFFRGVAVFTLTGWLLEATIVALR